MNFQDFMNQNAAAAPKPRSEGDEKETGVVVINMGAYTNVKDGDNYVGHKNHGNISFIPISAIDGKHLHYFYDVREWQVDMREQGAENPKWTWSRLGAESCYSALTDEMKDLMGQAKSYMTKAEELQYGTDWVRTKNYALIFGYVLSHINAEKVSLIDNTNRKLALIVVPSKNFAKAMTACNSSLSGMATGEAMYQAIYNRNSVRNCYLDMTFARSSGYGYDVTITAKTFDAFTSVYLTKEELDTPEKCAIVPQELIDQVGTHIGRFNQGLSDSTEITLDYIKTIHTAVKLEVEKAIGDARAGQNLAPPPVLENNNLSTGQAAWTPPADGQGAPPAFTPPATDLNAPPTPPAADAWQQPPAPGTTAG